MTGSGGQGCLASLASLLFGRRRSRQGTIVWPTPSPAVSDDAELDGQHGTSACPPAVAPLPARPVERLPYRLRDDFLSPAELSFYRVLLLATRGEVTVCAKVNLADIFFITHPFEHQAFHNKISSKHLDFLVCHPGTLQPILGIELDDGSHRNPARRERDDFVESVFLTAGLPLLRFPVRNVYDVRALAEAVGRHTGVAVPGVDATFAGAAALGQTGDAAPTCPKCGVPMVIRTASRGGHQGESFYGCPNYPRCRETRSMTS